MAMFKIKQDTLYGIDCNEVQPIKNSLGMFYIFQDDDVIEMTTSQAEQLGIELIRLITTTT